VKNKPSPLTLSAKAESGKPKTEMEKPAVLRLVSDPLLAARVEKLRIALTRQISRYGWRLMATALQTACEHGALHQRANPQAAALWQWRAHTLRELASRETVPPGDRPRAES
jgi:hypothetical protein